MPGWEMSVWLQFKHHIQHLKENMQVADKYWHLGWGQTDERQTAHPNSLDTGIGFEMGR